MPNPFSFTPATTTVTLDHAVKGTIFELVQTAATIATGIISDLNGNVLVSVACPATVGSYPMSPDTPIILPKTNPLTVTVTGSGAKFYVHYR